MAATAVKKIIEKMPMRVMGNTGMQVSVMSFGFWATFGAKEDLKDQAGIDKAKDILRVWRQNGVNLFDNWEAYGDKGSAEVIMGEAISQLREESPEMWKREDLLISTKLFWGAAGSPNQTGLSKKHISEGLNNCLKRLQCDYVDLLFCHRPDPYTPTETVVRWMTDAIRSGKAMTWGTSEWSAQAITEAYWIAKMYGLEPPWYEQPQYHMFWRQKCEVDFHPLYRAPYHLGLTIWSPLWSGLLSGKYTLDEKTGEPVIPWGSRADAKGYEFVKKKVETWGKDGTLAKVQELKKFWESKEWELDCTVWQLWIAWCIRNANVTTTLLGATTVEQLEENLKWLSVAQKMSKEHDDIIEDILGNKPKDGNSVGYQGYGGGGMRLLERLESRNPDSVRVPNYMLPLPEDAGLPEAFQRKARM